MEAKPGPRVTTATAITAYAAVCITRLEFLRAMHEERRSDLFMNRFRKLGYVDFDGRIKVHKSSLQGFLRD